MKIAVASDERTNLTDSAVQYLKEKGHELVLSGDLISKSGKWVEIGKAAAEMVANKEVEQAMLFCWSGTGVCMAANRVKGARAGLCWDVETARLARKWDNANILCISLRYTSEQLAREILDAWFSTAFDEEGLNEAHKLDE